MKRVKKIFAVLLSLAMVMGMSLTASATGLTSATITVNGADSGAKYSFVQIVEPDPSKTTGWEIKEDYQQYFKKSDAFGENADTQVIIKDMINSAKTTPERYQIASFDKNYAKALSYIFDSINDASVTDFTNTKTVSSSSEAGVYFIKIVGTGSGNEAITYSPLTAYVGFDTYTGGAPTALKDVTVNAKKEKNVVVKTNNDDDNIVSIGDEVTFTIEVKVPYIDWATVKAPAKFIVHDKITGAAYKDLSTATATMDNTTVPDVSFSQGVKTDEKDETNTFSVDLSSLVNNKNNQNAGKTVVLTYKAEITAVDEIKNTASAGNEDDTDLYGDPVDDRLYTGTIELLKYDADVGSNTAGGALSGAQFEVYMKNKDNSQTKLKFTGESGSYTWDKNSADTSKDTLDVGTEGNNKGKLNVTGLPQGDYVFKEVKAPEGYRIGENPDTSVVLKLDEGTSKASGDLIKNDVTVANSKLSSLPSTGGIGTTIFTVGGCAIMIIAAALFFASRRKSSK